MKNNMQKFYPYMCTYTCVHVCVPREVCELAFSSSEAEVLGFMKGLIPAPSSDPFSASWYENLVLCPEHHTHGLVQGRDPGGVSGMDEYCSMWGLGNASLMF